MSMDPDRQGVKRSREYDATGRRERARRQREAVLEHASTLLLARGYDATTVDSIARAAGCSAASVYKSFGGKAGVVRELCARALAGEGPTPAEERSDALRASSDLPTLLSGWGRLAAEVSPRISPLVLLLRRAAESDRDAASLLSEVEDARLARMADHAAYLVDNGLVAGRSVDEVRDVLWLVTAPELHDLVVVRRGWSLERFGAFVTSTLVGSLS